MCKACPDTNCKGSPDTVQHASPLHRSIEFLPGLGCRVGARCVPLQGVIGIIVTGRKIVPLEVFTDRATHASPLQRAIDLTAPGIPHRCPLRFSAGPELTLQRKSNENGCRGETMTVNEIASFCAFKNCRIWVGSPQAGFVEIGGSGVIRPSYTYGRFQMLSEVLPSSADQVIAAAHGLQGAETGSNARVGSSRVPR